MKRIFGSFLAMSLVSFFLLLMSGCEQEMGTDIQLIGNWKLEKVTRHTTGASELYQTGWETGVFQIKENHLATYKDRYNEYNGTWSFIPDNPDLPETGVCMDARHQTVLFWQPELCIRYKRFFVPAPRLNSF